MICHIVAARLTLMVSRGWQMLDSTRPAVPPAIRWRRGLFFLWAPLLFASAEPFPVADVPDAVGGWVGDAGGADGFDAMVTTQTELMT